MRLNTPLTKSLFIVGVVDELHQDRVLVYCPRCKQVMLPSMLCSNRYEEVELDGAYFGSTFPHLFFMAFPSLLPPPPLKVEPYIPRVFGFRVHNEDRAKKLKNGEELELKEKDTISVYSVRGHPY